MFNIYSKCLIFKYYIKTKIKKLPQNSKILYVNLKFVYYFCKFIYIYIIYYNVFNDHFSRDTINKIIKFRWV